MLNSLLYIVLRAEREQKDKRRMKMSKKTFLIGIVVVALVAALLFSTYLNININNSLQASLKKNRIGSSHMVREFRSCVGRATSIEYLLRVYRRGLRETELNEDNVEAVIEGFICEMEHTYLGFLYGLRLMNPELSEYKKPLYFIDRFIMYTFVVGQSSTGEPNVRSVLARLLAEASSFANYSIPVTSFKELNQISFDKMRELSFEVSESFYTPFNATRLDNTVDMVEELQSILSQWTDKYENVQV